MDLFQRILFDLKLYIEYSLFMYIRIIQNRDIDEANYFAFNIMYMHAYIT